MFLKIYHAGSLLEKVINKLEHNTLHGFVDTINLGAKNVATAWTILSLLLKVAHLVLLSSHCSRRVHAPFIHSQEPSSVRSLQSSLQSGQLLGIDNKDVTGRACIPQIKTQLQRNQWMKEHRGLGIRRWIDAEEKPGKGMLRLFHMTQAWSIPPTGRNPLLPFWWLVVVSKQEQLQLHLKLSPGDVLHWLLSL